MKVVLETRRPRLIAKETVAPSPNVSDDLEKVFALATDEEPCALVVNAKDESGAVPGADEKQWVVILWIPEGAPARMKTLWSTATKSIRESFLEMKFKEVQASERGELSADAVLFAAKELAQEQQAKPNAGLLADIQSKRKD